MPRPQKVNIQKALKQKLSGMSYQDIAIAQGVAKQTVHDRISPILQSLADPRILETYRSKQSDIIDGLTARTLANITDEKLLNSTAKDLGILSAVMIDKSRLISGLSTSNTALLVASAVRENIDEQY